MVKIMVLDYIISFTLRNRDDIMGYKFHSKIKQTAHLMTAAMYFGNKY